MGPNAQSSRLTDALMRVGTDAWWIEAIPAELRARVLARTLRRIGHDLANTALPIAGVGDELRSGALDEPTRERRAEILDTSAGMSRDWSQAIRAIPDAQKTARREPLHRALSTAAARVRLAVDSNVTLSVHDVPPSADVPAPGGCERALFWSCIALAEGVTDSCELAAVIEADDVNARARITLRVLNAKGEPLPPIEDDEFVARVIGVLREWASAHEATYELACDGAQRRLDIALS